MPTRSFLRVRVGTHYPVACELPRHKDVVTMCPDQKIDLAVAPVASADDADDTSPPDPARDAKPDGTPRCRTDGSNACRPPRKARNTQAERTSAPHIPHILTLRAGPRAPSTPTRSRPPRQAMILPKEDGPDDAYDNADSAGDGTHDLHRSHGTRDSPSPDASDTPLPDRLSCNTGPAAAQDGTFVHTPSANTADRDEMTLA